MTPIHTSISLLVLYNGGVKVTQFLAGHFQLLFLVAERDLLQLTLELSLSLEEVVSEAVLQVILLGLQLCPLQHASLQLTLHGLDVFSQFLHLNMWVYITSQNIATDMSRSVT